MKFSDNLNLTFLTSLSKVAQNLNINFKYLNITGNNFNKKLQKQL